MRSLLVLAWIGLVGGAAVLVATRPTIASGKVIAADLTESNHATVTSMVCDPEIRVHDDGARFACAATFRDGSTAHLSFVMDRDGMIKQAAAAPHERVKKTSDPWGD
ncbi:MAG TPA: hypothetical protein VLX92_19830 [Kofleriaceae bacterium]|nr:hypothetical protein [Kofleriaceae bacterium]